MGIALVRPFLDHGPRPAGVKVNLIVLHATAGSSLRGAIDTLRKRGLGYHYLIDKAGVIHKGAPYTRRTGHAGNSYGPNEEARGVSRKQDGEGKFVAGCGVNDTSIGISFVNRNDGRDPYTAKQQAAVRELIEVLKAECDDLEWVSTHALVSPGRKSDPLGFDLDALAHDVGLKAWRYGARR